MSGKEFPKLQLFDRTNFLKEDLWVACKGCAGGTNESVLRLLKEYDLQNRIRMEGDGVFLKTGNSERALSYSTVDTIGIHMPHSGKIFPKIRLADNQRVIPVFRANGPRESNINHIGLSAFLLELLQSELGTELPFKQGQIVKVDVRGEKPVLITSKGESIDTDLVILTNGVSRGNIQILTEDGEVQLKPSGISTYLREIEAPNSTETNVLYGKKRNVAHVVIAKEESSVHYAFFIPQKVRSIDKESKITDKTVITMAAFGKEGQQISRTDLNVFINSLPINYFTGDAIITTGSITCSCASFIPTRPVDINILKKLAKKSVIVFGDAAGTSKLLKNGIGTTTEQAQAIARFLSKEGISEETLVGCVDVFYNMFVPDNEQYGQPLLDWVDNMFNRRYLPPILNFFLLAEQLLPRKFQRALPNIAESSIGATSYEKISIDLQSGFLGHIISLLSLIIGNPLPKKSKR